MGSFCFRATSSNKDHHPHPHGHIDNFSYVKGGSEWEKEFGLKIGHRQSPINIPLKEVITEKEQIPIAMKMKFNSNPLSINVVFTPTTYLVKHSSDFIGELQVEDLKTKEIQHYQSMSCHFHSKSEHLFDGVQYDAECHIVFVKKEVPEQTDKTVDVLCVLGVLFKIDDENAKESNSKIITDFSPNDPQSVVLVNFNQLLGPSLVADPEFYHYKGSLTTPPCAEIVSWFVHSKVLPIKKDDLKAFTSKWVENKEFCPAGTGNSRPACELHDRKVYKLTAINF